MKGEEFLAFVTGTKGVKMMYDFISKAILNQKFMKKEQKNFYRCCFNTEEYAKRINKKERKQNHVIEI